MATAQVNDLRRLVERIEAMNEEVKERQRDVRELYVEARSKGYDVKALRRIIKERAADPQAEAEIEAIVELYRNALGLRGTPLGEYADRAGAAA
jgi:uncharacterized protein (UPF0335 family)